MNPAVENAEDISTQLKKIADHLVFLEKKIDTLIKNAESRPQGGFGNRPPRREFGNRGYGSGGGYQGNRQAYGRSDARQGQRPYGQGHGPQRPHRPGGTKHYPSHSQRNSR